MIPLFLSLFFIRARCETDDDDDGDFGWGLDGDDETPKEINWDEVPTIDVIILGSGPAGCTAALYAARAGYNTVVLHGDVPGGQLVYTTEVENFPSWNGTGTELVEAMKDQAIRNGAKFVLDTIVEVDLSVFPRRLTSHNNVGYKCRSLIIATGAKAKYLGLPSEQRLKNRGVSACAVCDGALYAGQDVAIVGGGDVAAEEALYLAKICRSVKLFHRRGELRASTPMKKRLQASKVEINYFTEVDEVIGQDYVTAVRVINTKTKKTTTHNIAALFVAIGHQPETSMFDKQLDRDANGYFITDGTPKTKVAGVFVAGDCADKVYRQAITSAGTGCQAALLAEHYLAELDAEGK